VRRSGAAGPVGPALRSCLAAAVVVVVGGAGLFAFSSSSTSTSQVRMDLAAGVLALLSTLAAVVCLPRTRWPAVLRGGCSALVAVLVGVATGLYVGAAAGAVAGLVAGVPWVVGALAGAAVSPFVGDLGRVRLRRR
jgi:hypothetical protein